VQVQAHKIILMGSTPIAPTPSTENAITLLLQHPFTHTWQWETLMVGNLPQLTNDIQLARAMQSVMDHSKPGKEQQRG